MVRARLVPGETPSVLLFLCAHSRLTRKVEMDVNDAEDDEGFNGTKSW